jgi:hypothetical protein
MFANNLLNWKNKLMAGKIEDSISPRNLIMQKFNTKEKKNYCSEISQ